MSIELTITTIIDWIHQDRAAEELESVVLRADTRLLDAAIFDSLKLLQFVSWLEGHYGINVGVENLTPSVFASPHTIAELVERLKQE